MALYHFHADLIRRGKAQSAVAAAAYRAGEKLYSEYYGEHSDYTKGWRAIHRNLIAAAGPQRVSRQGNALERGRKSRGTPEGTASIQL